MMLKNVRLNDRIVNLSSRSFLHANISLYEEREKKKKPSKKRKEGWMDGLIKQR